MGIRLRRYLDDWLVQSPFREAVLRNLRVVLDLCRELGIVVNPEMSNFIPSQRVLYLGTILDSRSFVASLSPDRIASLLSLGDEFVLRSAASLLLAISSRNPVLSVPSCSRGQDSHAVPAVSAAPVLDRLDDSALVAWTPACRLDLL